MSCEKNPGECKHLNEMISACSTDGLHSVVTVHEYKSALVECICESESEIQCTCRKKVADTLHNCKTH